MPRPSRKARHRRADPEKPWEWGWECPGCGNAHRGVKISDERLAELRSLYGTRGALTMKIERDAAKEGADPETRKGGEARKEDSCRDHDAED